MSSPISSKSGNGINTNDHKRKRGQKNVFDGLDLNAILHTERTRTPAINNNFVQYFSSDDKPIAATKTRKITAVHPNIDTTDDESCSEPEEDEIDDITIIASSRNPEAPLSDDRDEEIEESTTALEDFENGHYWDPNQTGGAKRKNLSKSVEYYKKAAEKLHPVALFRLGIFHETGVKGCRGGIKEAAELYEKAGKADNADGWNNLGALYHDEKLDVRDCKERAYACFKKAIECTTFCPSAHNNLGLCLEQGLRVEKNSDLARYHFHIGAEGGDPDAQYNLAVQYEHGRGQDRDYFDNGIKQSDERAQYWYQRSMENPQNTNKEWAQYALGKLGQKRRIAGVNPDDERVIYLIKQAAKKKFAPAMIRYAEIKKDNDKPKKALALLKEATQVDPKSGKAKYQLALCYLNGTVTKRNIELSLKLLNEAVDAKYCLIKQRDWNQINRMISPQDSFALLMKMKDNQPNVGQIHYELALSYLEEAGIPRSIKTGVQYFDKAVELNNCVFDTNRVLSVIKQAAQEKNLEASFELANITLNGELGVDASANKAIEILSQAVLDHPESHEAKYKLSLYYFEGIGTERDIKAASVLLKDANRCDFQINQEELLEKFHTLKTEADESKDAKTLLETAWCLEAGLGNLEETLKYCHEIIEIAQKTSNKPILTEATDIMYRIGDDLVDLAGHELAQKGIQLLEEASKLGNKNAIEALTKLASDRLQSLLRDAQTSDPQALARLAELAGQQSRR